jgi:hypothetical protein
MFSVALSIIYAKCMGYKRYSFRAAVKKLAAHAGYMAGFSPEIQSMLEFHMDHYSYNMISLLERHTAFPSIASLIMTPFGCGSAQKQIVANNHHLYTSRDNRG